jgi:hypothetical protein
MMSDIRGDGTIRPLTHHQETDALVDVHTDERPLSGRRLPLKTDHSADMFQLFLDLGIESGPHRQAPPSRRTLAHYRPVVTKSAADHSLLSISSARLEAVGLPALDLLAKNRCSDQKPARFSIDQVMEKLTTAGQKNLSGAR